MHLNPSDPLPDTYIARAYVKIGEYAKAIQYAQQAVTNNPDDPYHVWKPGVQCFYRNQQYSDAIIALRTAIRGGTTEDGTIVKGLPLDYTERVMEFYYTYGLALAKLNQCGEAVQIAQTILQTVMDDETSVYNAQVMITNLPDKSGYYTHTRGGGGWSPPPHRLNRETPCNYSDENPLFERAIPGRIPTVSWGGSY